MPSLEKSFQEIKRILKPYGQLIGREPNDDNFIAETDPWIAGAIASLCHLIYRKTRTGSNQEPKVHQYHRNFKIADFVNKDLGNFFTVKDIVAKYPFSSQFTRIGSAFYGYIILKTDKFLNNYKGNQFFYLAAKNGYGKSEVLSYINTYLRNLEDNSKTVPPKFIKRLILLTAFFDLILPNK
ncbi:MAG: Class SAM-dependent methyltransferase [Candidatus Berkelbacteria bacterium]|nr:Class SAM-dependent methyltransferase [Candidatus Berkelbacteria bacterium]